MALDLPWIDRLRFSDSEDFEEPGFGRWLDSPMRSLSFSWLAILPLFVIYELARLTTPELEPNVGELIFGLSFQFLGGGARYLRWLILGAGLALALRNLHRDGPWTDGDPPLATLLARTLLESLGLALLLGPLLILGVGLFGFEAPVAMASESSPTLSRAARILGGAAYEELVFRVGLLSACFLLLRLVLVRLRVEEVAAGWIAEFVAIVLAAALFAWAHFNGFMELLGHGGELFSMEAFAWRFLAGILLGLAFRLRGAGVAAWTHGLFNLGLAIGVGPEVLRHGAGQ